jgi:hypothetical protein
MAEPVAIIIFTIILLVLTPRGSVDFWLTFVALLGRISIHAVYWLLTHPVNNFRLQGENLSGLGSGFFSLASVSRHGRQSDTRPVDWTDLRDRWEYSHVARRDLQP